MNGAISFLNQFLPPNPAFRALIELCALITVLMLLMVLFLCGLLPLERRHHRGKPAKHRT
jgi:hypothetical protein